MLIEDIVEAIEENEEWAWESEARFKYYSLTYDVETKRLELYFIEEYHFDGDNWGEIEKKISKSRVFYAEYIRAEMYINLLISIINNREELEHLFGSALNKVRFERV